MTFWVYLVLYVASFLVTELLRPKPAIEDAKPAGLGDFKVPTATEGRVVPIIWGRVKISGPNVIWYGDLRAKPQKEKIKTGMFSSDTQIVGFEYSLGIQFGLCRGPVTLLRHIRNDESFVWGPEASTADTPIIPVDAGAVYSIDQPEFFGGKDAGGGGGLVGGGRIYPGSETQTANTYLAGFQSPTPGYRGTCYLTWERGKIGFAPQIRAFEFELERFPNGLGLSAATNRIGDSVNPMSVVYECLTNQEWGLSKNAATVDVTEMTAIATTLKTEGNGFAWIWDRPLDVLEIVRMIEQQVDGILIKEPVSGKWSFKLIRFDYTPAALELLDESNVKKIIRFSRPAWTETQNQVQAEFTDPRKNYTTGFGIAQDMANIDIVGSISASKVRFPGVKDPTLINSLVWREIRQLSFPAATMQLEVDRSQYDITPGDVRAFSWDLYGLSRMPIRITKVDRGNILNGTIRLDCAQDIFSFAAGTFSDPIDTGWTAPVDTASAPTEQFLFEVPYRLSGDQLGANTTDPQVGTVVVSGGTMEVGYNIYSKTVDAPGVVPTIVESDVIPPGSSSGLAPYGLLTAALDRGQTNGFQDATGFTIDNTVDVFRVEDATAAELEAQKNALIIDDEIILFETIVDNGNGTYTVSDLIRGALDTVPAAHVDNSKVYFISYGLGLVNEAPFATDPTLSVQAKIQPFTPFDTYAFSSITATAKIETVHRAGRGYPARNVQAAASYFPTTLSDPFTVTWRGSDKFNQPFALAWDGARQPEESGVTFRIRIIEDPTGTPIVKQDLTGLTVDVLGDGSQVMSGWSAGEVTNSYQAEITSQHANGDSQVWIIGPFTRV